LAGLQSSNSGVNVLDLKKIRRKKFRRKKLEKKWAILTQIPAMF
jgi:hypothetical protein